MLDGSQATLALSRLQRALLLIACIVFFFMTQRVAFLLVGAGMIFRLFTRDAPAEPSTRVAVYFTVLLFALGALLKIIPLQPINR